MDKTEKALRASQLGMLVSVLLILSRLFIETNDRAFNSIYTVLVFAVLFLCGQLVRRVSSVRQAHVWNAPFTLALAIGVTLNLAAAVLEMVWGAAFLSSYAYKAVSVAFSLPLLLSLICGYMSYCFPALKTLRAVSSVILGCAGAYAVLRLLNDVVFPLVSYNARKIINPKILSVTAWNRSVSLVILVLAFCASLTLFTEMRAVSAQAAETPAPPEEAPEEAPADAQTEEQESAENERDS